MYFLFSSLLLLLLCLAWLLQHFRCNINFILRSVDECFLFRTHNELRFSHFSLDLNYIIYCLWYASLPWCFTLLSNDWRLAWIIPMEPYRFWASLYLCTYFVQGELPTQSKTKIWNQNEINIRWVTHYQVAEMQQ